MAYGLDQIGHLDLTPCFMKHGYDWFAVERLAREYYFSELINLQAWDGITIRGMNDERKFLHLICKHGHDSGPVNQLMDLDIKRIAALPVLKAVVEGRVRADVYRQTTRTGEDKIEIVVDGPDTNYIVVLGCVRNYYIIRSAYPGGDIYPERVKRRSNFVQSIIP